jgi:hypothetical protein
LLGVVRSPENSKKTEMLYMGVLSSPGNSQRKHHYHLVKNKCICRFDLYKGYKPWNSLSASVLTINAGPLQLHAVTGIREINLKQVFGDEMGLKCACLCVWLYGGEVV